MDKYILQKIKKGQGNIMLGVFFIILVLVMIFLFTRYHEIMLFSNYNINEDKLNIQNLYYVKNNLYDCYSFPMKIDSDIQCPNINDFSFKLEAIDNGVCDREVYLQNGADSTKKLTLTMVVYEQQYEINCPAILTYYIQDDTK